MRAARRPDLSVLVAFACVVLIGGSNFVAVRFSNRELDPFWGAGLRFAFASALLLVIVRRSGIPLPRRDALPGLVLFGTVNFGLTYAFAYWGLVEGPAAVAATLVALGPLLTFFITAALGMERFRWSGLAGGAISLVGVIVVFADQLRFDVPLASLVALVLNAIGLSSGVVLLKRLPRTHPVATNAVAMVPGALLLILLAVVSGERLALPTRPDSTIAFVYLVTVGSIGLFAGFVYIVQHWTASATSYVSVLFPIVAVGEGALLAGEVVTWPLVAGAALVMAGTYVGALAQPGAGRAATSRVEGTAED